tara:strand:+ start:237 stop:608 length:372 start_codon:yes stop_codon:yes gene_type:complete
MILLSDGNKYYQYSGEIIGDVSAPATISMILIPNTGLRDSLVQIYPFFGVAISNNVDTSLGVRVLLDDVAIYTAEHTHPFNFSSDQINTTLFVPRQSKLEIISLNNASNNTQTRGCNILGYYL